MKDERRNELTRLLLQHLRSGTVNLADVRPVLEELLPGAPPPLAELHELLDDDPSPAIRQLRQAIFQQMLAGARQCHERTVAGDPADATPQQLGLPANVHLGWRNEKEVLPVVHAVTNCLRDTLFLDSRDGLHELQIRIDGYFQDSLQSYFRLPSRWHGFEPAAVAGEFEQPVAALAAQRRQAALTRVTQAVDALPAPVPVDVDEQLLMTELKSRFTAATTRAEQRELLDVALCWPGDIAAGVIRDLCLEEWAQCRAVLMLAMRFGRAEIDHWTAAVRWLDEQIAVRNNRLQSRRLKYDEAAPYLLFLWSIDEDDQESELSLALHDELKQRAAAYDVGKFVAVWHDYMSPAELNLLTGRRPGEMTAAVDAGQAGVADVADDNEQRPPDGADAPAFWAEHIRPLLHENWYMVVGLVMVIFGASLLAYFTWDKHWLMRYTIMPALLAGLTIGFAESGGWLQRRFAELRGTAIMIRAAAIGLLPVNFMAVALLSNDSQVATHARWALPVMMLVYMTVFGWGLIRWCRAVHQPSAGRLYPALLALNVIVPAGASSRFFHVAEGTVVILLGVLLYLGFIVLAGTIRSFAQKQLTREMIIGRLIPWFVGGVLVLTYVEVFAWVHWVLHLVPQASHYAVLAVLAGGLIMLVERQYHRKLNSDVPYLPESFIGYAAIIVGILMGLGDQYVRIAVLVLAGALWLYQATLRKGEVHHWVGLTILAMGWAAIGTLDAFPRRMELNLLPVLGLCIALGIGAVRALARRFGNDELSAAATEFQPAILFLTAIVSMLSQWHYRSAPLATGLTLIVIAAFFAWRAYRARRLGWVHSTMALLALALPYLGCVDMAGRSLHGNTLVFGLAVLGFLWLAIGHWVQSDLLRRARSTVLFAYGAVAVAAMVVRVVMERGRFGETDAVWLALDLCGPVLMTVVLAFAAYHSRSLIPGFMAAVILAVLFPELKQGLEERSPIYGWGSGLASAISALALCLVAFPLIRSRRLKALGEGDLFLGHQPFPMQRRDYTLFTIPMLSAAIFLGAKVNTWSLCRNLVGTDGVGLKTAIALALAGTAWTVLAVLLRRRPWSTVMVHLGWLSFFSSITVLVAFHCGFTLRLSTLYGHPEWPLAILFTGILLQLLCVLYHHLERRLEWLGSTLRTPTETVLRIGSMAAGVGLCVHLIVLASRPSVAALCVFVAMQLSWSACKSQKRQPAASLEGCLLFFLAAGCVLSWTAPGTGPLIPRLTFEYSFSPLLLLVIVTQLACLAFERGRGQYQRFAPVLVPWQVGTSVLALSVAVAAVYDVLLLPPVTITVGQQVLLGAALLLTARTTGSGAFVLFAVTIGFFIANADALTEIAGPVGSRSGLDVVWRRLVHLMTPWRGATLMAALAVTGALGRVVHQQLAARWLMIGSYPAIKRFVPASSWLFAPAVMLAWLLPLTHAMTPVYRQDPAHLWAPYLGALTCIVVAWSWRQQAMLRHSLGTGAGILLALANVHTINILFGSHGRLAVLVGDAGKGLSHIHVVCLGFAFTMLQTLGLRAAVRHAGSRWIMTFGNLILAALILMLLAFNYLVHPDVSQVTSLRLVVSGLLAFGAGHYLRHLSRSDALGAKAQTVCKGFYHCGVTLALWCIVLLIPAMRDPGHALYALGIAPVYFYLRAEFTQRNGGEQTKTLQYHHSATLLVFALLVLFVFKAAFQMILFPNTAVDTSHYHLNAPLVVLLSILLFRLHGLGGTWWLAFYGGAALVTGTYFSITWYPGLSPFDNYMAAAWVAVAVAHLFTLASHQRSPVRALLQEIARIDGETWIELRRSWGYFILVASQFLVLLGVLDFQSDTYQVAPLLAAAASVWIHHGVIRRSTVYCVVAVVQLLMALHMDFVIASHLDRDHVIWVLLALWAGIVFGHPLLRRRLPLHQLRVIGLAFFFACVPHVIYHRPDSAAGLWAVLFMAIILAFTPRATKHPQGGSAYGVALAMLLAPPWLVFFMSVDFPSFGLAAVVQPLPVLLTSAVVMFTGYMAHRCEVEFAPALERHETTQPRIWHQTLGAMTRAGRRLQTLAMALSFVALSGLFVRHYNLPYSGLEMMLCVGLWAAQSVLWFREGRQRKSIAANAIAQVAVIGLSLVMRRQLMLTHPEVWTTEYDVWAALAVSMCMTGGKQLIDKQDRELQLPYLVSLCALPVLAIAWVLVHGLGTDICLIVVLLYSAMFTFLGRGSGNSPYNIVAVGGFVAFVAILFWSKLELRALHAYVIPTGVGILALVQMFGNDLSRRLRMQIRAATLAAMLGTTAYYALLDDRYQPAFHVTMLLLSLAVMAGGTLFRIRVFLLFGAGGVLVDLGTIFYKIVIRLDGHYQMTSFGVVILLVGIVLVAGTAYYKTQRQQFEARLDAWRAWLGRWD
ncbi:MAG: hypothetical protein QGF67_00550 [Lentisphaeria bacterium]|nr:hypothetical protein [Lentisphaeria bacterium]